MGGTRSPGGTHPTLEQRIEESLSLLSEMGTKSAPPSGNPPLATVSVAIWCLVPNPSTSMAFLQATCLLRFRRTPSPRPLASNKWPSKYADQVLLPAEYDAGMGKLIDRKRREQAKTDRPTHKAAILEAARKALLTQPPGELTLEMLDRIAGLRQGSASIFYGSLEGLIIRMLREEMSSWLDQLGSILQQGPEALSPSDLARLLATTLHERPLFCRLLAALPAMADRRTVEMDQVLELEKVRLQQFEKTGPLIEARCPDFKTGSAMVILRRAVLLAGALEPLVNPPSGLLLSMNDESLSPLYPDSKEELCTLLEAVLSAMVD